MTERIDGRLPMGIDGKGGNDRRDRFKELEGIVRKRNRCQIEVAQDPPQMATRRDERGAVVGEHGKQSPLVRVPCESRAQGTSAQSGLKATMWNYASQAPERSNSTTLPEECWRQTFLDPAILSCSGRPNARVHLSAALGGFVPNAYRAARPRSGSVVLVMRSFTRRIRSTSVYPAAEMCDTLAVRK